MKYKVLLVILLLITNGIFSQNKINYKHKALLKALQKADIEDPSVLEEVYIADSIIESNHLNGKYFIVNSKNVSQIKYIYVGRVNSCRAGGCSISDIKPQNGNFEYFDYCILFDQQQTVQTVKVFNYQATHGHEITSKGWLKQFKGHKTKAPLQVGKNIDAISGATISVYAITYDVDLKTDLLKTIESY